MQLLQFIFFLVISIGVVLSWPITKGSLNNLSNKRGPFSDTRYVDDENGMELNAQDSFLNRKPRDDEHPCSSAVPESIVSDDQKSIIGDATQIQKRESYERKLYTFYIGSLLINIIMLVILITTCIKIMKLSVSKPPKEQAKIGKPCPTKCKKDCSHAVKLPPNDDFDPPIKDCTCLTSEARTINFDKEEMNEEYGKCNEQTPFLKTLEGLTGKIPVGKRSSIKMELEGDCIKCNDASSSDTDHEEKYKQEVRPAKSSHVSTEDYPYKFLARKRVASWQGYQTKKSESFDYGVNSSRGPNSKKSESSTYNSNNIVTHNHIASQIDTTGQIAGLEEAMPIVEEDSSNSFSDN